MPLIGPSARISARHHEVTIQMATDDTSDSGFPVEGYTDLATLMAAREPVVMQGGAERFDAGQLSARSFHRWTMPYLEAIDPDVLPIAKMRLLYRAQSYDILEAHVVNMRADIVMTTMVKAA